MYGCESWTIKEAEHQRTDAFKLWCQRVPWTARKSNQSILKEINLEYSLEGLMLKLQYLGHLMWKADSLQRHWCWKRLRAGREEDNRGQDGWMASLTQQRIWVWTSSRRWWRTRKPDVLQSMGLQRVRNDWAAWCWDRVVTWERAWQCYPHCLWGMIFSHIFFFNSKNPLWISFSYGKQALM